MLYLCIPISAFAFTRQAKSRFPPEQLTERIWTCKFLQDWPDNLGMWGIALPLFLRKTGQKSNGKDTFPGRRSTRVHHHGLLLFIE